MLDATVGIRPHHLMIAGTGRAGPTFLVRYLTELGLCTHLSAHPDAVADSYAEAGFEEVPLACDRETLPYVIKSPNLYGYIDELLQSVHLNAAIIPVRDLNLAASSRMVAERDAMHRAVPWLADNSVAWDTWSWSRAARCSRSIRWIRRDCWPSDSISLWSGWCAQMSR